MRRRVGRQQPACVLWWRAAHRDRTAHLFLFLLLFWRVPYLLDRPASIGRPPAPCQLDRRALRELASPSSSVLYLRVPRHVFPLRLGS
jgi:hypothetical protein